jgi:transposase InsO family protein
VAEFSTGTGAAAESFFATIKAEIGIAHWPDRASARRDIENWIRYYNHRRLHSTLDYKTPVEDSAGEVVLMLVRLG